MGGVEIRGTCPKNLRAKRRGRTRAGALIRTFPASFRGGEAARGAEQAVETMKNLASLAGDLEGMIRQFRLEGETQSGGILTGKPSAVLQQKLQPAQV